LIQENVYRAHENTLTNLEGTTTDPVSKVISKAGVAVGLEIDGTAYAGFPTPSRKLEFFSRTLKDWKWQEHAIPGYIKSHVHPDNIDQTIGEMLLLPTFRLPTLIHTRSANAKWLYEISHRNPIWLHPSDAQKFDVKNGDLLKIHTEIGYFVDKIWMTEAIKPGVIACSHHLGRWRLQEDSGGERWSTALVHLKETEPGKWMMRQLHGIKRFKSEDPDSERIWWEDGGVHQNLTFPVQPDFISGQHCWHQKVRVEKAGSEDKYGDIFVDTNKSHEVYKRWLQKTRPAPGPNNLRRPLWLPRSYRPAEEAYYLNE
jgi:anaerobic selenocysteine-containing dehydrogenase